MGIITRIFGKEKRGGPSDPRFWHQFSNVFKISASGKIVTADTAMGQATVYACVKVLSETIASLPLFLYRKRGDGAKVPATQKSLFALLHDQPNSVWSKFDYWEYTQAAMLLRGNAYDWIEYNNAGQPIAIWPLNAMSMEFEVGVNSKGARRIVKYKYNIPETQKIVEFEPWEIWHHKDMIGTDGVSGVSRIEQVKNTVGLSLSADEYGARFYENDATPGGVLEYSGILDTDNKKDLVKSWEEVHKGSGKSFKTALLEGGMKYTPISMSQEDAQFIETRSFQVADIARIFKVPTIMIGGAGTADKSNTFASAEQQMLSFVQNTIRPWAVRHEASIAVNLLDEKERKNHFAEFKLEGLLRGDIKTRYEAYKVGREWGWLSVDDVRRLENLDPLGEDKGGQEYVRPMNMQALGEEPEPIVTPPPAVEPEEETDEE